MNQLHLTFIPPEYWTKSTNFFELIQENSQKKAVKLPKEVGFFVLWINEELLQLENLENRITKIFPSIPAKKLNTCKISLAVPSQSTKKKKTLLVKIVLGKIVPVPPMISLLFGLKLKQSSRINTKIVEYSNSIKTWVYLTKFSIELLNRGSFIPNLEKNEDIDPCRIYENPQMSFNRIFSLYNANWKMVLRSLKDWDRFNKILKYSPWATYNLPINLKKEKINNNTEFYTTALWNPSYLFVSYMDLTADYIIRSSLGKSFESKFYEVYGFSSKENYIKALERDDLYWENRLLNSLIGKNKEFQITKFSETPIPNIIKKWTKNIQGFPFQLGVMFSFKLEYPKESNDEWKLGYYIQPLQEFENFIELGDFWNCDLEQRKELENVCEDIDLLEEEILRALGTAAKYFPPISRSLKGTHPKEIFLDTSEVMDFLKYSMYLLIQAGFNIELPEQFKKQGEQRLNAKIVIDDPQEMIIEDENTKEDFKKTRTSVQKAPMLGLDTLLDYKWEVTIENQKISEEDFQNLIKSEEPLVFINGKWILINPRDMETLKPIFSEKSSQAAFSKPKGKISYSDALKYGIVGDVSIGDETSFNVIVKGNFKDKIHTILGVTKFEDISTPECFHGNLREYQKTALQWLANMADLNLGVCLADDMGLGKTVEVIAFLTHRKYLILNNKAFDKAILVICPTSVLFNWKREIEKFAPDIHIRIHHGSSRLKNGKALTEYTKKFMVILTTYGTVRNDIDFLETIPFTGVIIDESQNIKNYRAKKSQAVMNLRAQYRIALSGTPVENKLEELWTLFEFLNPGFLGSREKFRTRFINPIENFQDEKSSRNLHKMISPFILRRVKTDKSIIKDLPEKNEIKMPIELSNLQKNLYSAVVESTLKELEDLQGDLRKRRGNVLKLLTLIKQICNHPFQFLKEDRINDYRKLLPLDYQEYQNYSEVPIKQLIKTSIKLQRLMEMSEEILETSDKMLIFTQYTRMGEILKYTLEKTYEQEVLFFHGQLSKTQREKMVDEFQSDRIGSPSIMILSLKAGGVGLNLTQASTVFHYDRWWNPAVEDQATDRAYRIGQKQTVNVFKFISIGTIEEKIDKILEEKRDLADLIIKNKDETFITNLSNEDLKDLFKLSL